MLWVVRRAQEEGKEKREGKREGGVVLLLSLLAAPFNQALKLKCVYIYMRQSCVEIKDYSVTYFKYIATFEGPYR